MGLKHDDSTRVSLDLLCWGASASHHFCAQKRREGVGFCRDRTFSGMRPGQGTYGDASRRCHGDNSSSLSVSAMLVPGTPALGNEHWL